MARRKTNLADVAIGANAVGNVLDVTFITPDVDPIVADELHADDIEVIDVASRGEWALEVECSLNSEDTNGQVAMETAYMNRTSVSLSYYPEGNTTGNSEWSGDAVVTRIPNVGGQGKNNVARGSFRMVWKTKPTKGTVS